MEDFIMAKHTKAEIAEALENCRRHFPQGSTVFTIVRSVSRSGMSRDISIVTIHEGDDCRKYALHPNYMVSVVLGLRLMRDAVKVNGCGMDMAWWLVDYLSHTLYGRGDALTLVKL